MFWLTTSQEVLQMEPITYKAQGVLLHNKCNANIMCVVDTIVDDVSEAGIDKNGIFSTINLHVTPLPMANIYQTS